MIHYLNTAFTNFDIILYFLIQFQSFFKLFANSWGFRAIGDNAQLSNKRMWRRPINPAVTQVRASGPKVPIQIEPLQSAVLWKHRHYLMPFTFVWSSRNNNIIPLENLENFANQRRLDLNCCRLSSQIKYTPSTSLDSTIIFSYALVCRLRSFLLIRLLGFIVLCHCASFCARCS